MCTWFLIGTWLNELCRGRGWRLITCGYSEWVLPEGRAVWWPAGRLWLVRKERAQSRDLIRVRVCVCGVWFCLGTCFAWPTSYPIRSSILLGLPSFLSHSPVLFLFYSSLSDPLYTSAGWQPIAFRAFTPQLSFLPSNFIELPFQTLLLLVYFWLGAY
jgi:hypothetical protein